MKRRTVFILAACVTAVVFGAVLVGGVALWLHHNQSSGAGGGSSWSSSQYLDVHLEGELPEQSAPSLNSFLDRRPLSLRTVIQSLDRAAKDSRVKSVVLRVDSLPDAGWGKVEELRAAVTRFRKSGKDAYAYLEFSGNKEYYLATACSKVYAVPTGLLDVNGLSAEVMFLKNTLQKLGVEAQFVGIGKYKNAPNQFTESGFTAPHREQMNALVDSLFAEYVKGIAEARRLSPDKVRAILDEGPFDAREAEKKGLVDGLLYRDQLDDLVKGESRVTPSRYVKSASSGFGLGTRPKLALIYVVGEITLGRSHEDAFGSSGNAGSDTIAEAIRRAREDDDVKGIVLRVDSPGGSGTASDVIWREVHLAQEKKPVVTSMGDYAASGGYYVSMGSDAIVAQPGTITGSIGVFAGKFSLRGLYDKVGVTKETITRGRHADIFTEYRSWNPEERARVQSLMESFYKEFVDKAAAGRKHSYEQIHEVAQGRVWSGSDALKHGLVDRLGGLETAIALVKERAKIGAGEDVDVVVLPERKGLLETLFEQDDSLFESRLPADVRTLMRWAATLKDGVPSARLPFDIRVR
jgi:protease-4